MSLVIGKSSGDATASILEDFRLMEPMVKDLVLVLN